MAEPRPDQSLFSGEPPTTSRRAESAPARPRQLWLAARLDHPALRAATVGAECRCLEALATRARELTPFVSIERPDSVLLEVRGSLKLFGGLEAVKARLGALLTEHGFGYELRAAPTPLAALWLARHGSVDVLDPGALAARLGALPIRVTAWPDAVVQPLMEMGVHTVGDCLRLPRPGFARRVGPNFLRQLDQALGRCASLRSGFEPEQTLSGTVELAAGTASAAVLARALGALVASLTADLRRRQRQARILRAVFRHLHRPATSSRIELVAPAHEPQRLLDPLLARLERTMLPAPVTAITLSMEALTAISIEAAELFAEREAVEPDAASAAALIEHLRARFGTEEVYGLELVAEHRPERAWGKATARLLERRNRGGGALPGMRERPLWILPEPLPLARGAAEIGGGGRLQGERAGIERIESGWWDGEDISRDYYAVTTAEGQRWWVYRDCATSGWYLHGIFG